MEPIHVIGGGLAGSEAAWQIAEAGVPVVLHEMRPVRGTDAHQTDGLAELVCSNSFRSDDWEHNAVGLLHAEMRALRLADHGAAATPTRCRPAARWRWTATASPTAVTARLRGPPAGHHRARARSPACRRPTGTA